MPLQTAGYVLSFGPNKIKLFLHFTYPKEIDTKIKLTIRDAFIRKLFACQLLAPFIVIHQTLFYNVVPLVQKVKTYLSQFSYDYHLYCYERHTVNKDQHTQFPCVRDNLSLKQNNSIVTGPIPVSSDCLNPVSSCLNLSSTPVNPNNSSIHIISDLATTVIPACLINPTNLNCSPDEFDSITLSSSLCKDIDMRIVGNCINWGRQFESSSTALNLVAKLQKINRNDSKCISEDLLLSKEMFLDHIVAAQRSVQATLEVDIPHKIAVSLELASGSIDENPPAMCITSKPCERIEDSCQNKNINSSQSKSCGNTENVSFDHEKILGGTGLDSVNMVKDKNTDGIYNARDSQETECVLDSSKSESESSSTLQICSSPFYDACQSQSPNSERSSSDQDYTSPPCSPNLTAPCLNHLSLETNQQYQKVFEEPKHT